MKRASSFDTVIVVHDYGDIRGGQEKVAVESALGLADAGFDVVFFCACAPVDPRFEPAGIRVVCLDIPDLMSNPSKVNAVKSGIWNKFAADAFDRLLSEYDPHRTIIHIHGWTKALSSSIGPVITAPNRRHVYTMHEYFLACPNGGFFHYGKSSICEYRALGPRCILSNCDQRNYGQKVFRVARQAVAKAKGRLPGGLRDIIFISDLQRQAMSPYLSGRTKMHSVSNPVSVEKAPRVKAEAKKDFVFVGRLEPVKGAIDFAEAAAKSALRAKFVGDGVQADVVRKINPDAEITGWVSPSGVVEAIKSARCLVFPSHWYECQPLVPYEALAMGVPVITYDVSAAREAVKSGLNGEVVSFSERQAALPRALEKLADDDTVKKLSEQAYTSYWHAPLTLDRHVSRLVEVYEELHPASE